MTSIGQLARDFRWGHRPLVPTSAQAERPVHERREFRTEWARRPSARAARAVLQAGVLKPLMKAELTPTIAGLEVLAELDRTPCVIVANHSSHLDTAVLISALPAPWRRRTAVAAAADYFFDAWWRAVPTALILGTVPIERKGGAPSRTPGELLAQGWNLVVFPEGTRSRDGWQGRFRLGAAGLALAAGAPVLPVAITGSYAAMPRGRNWPAPGRPAVSVRFGAPLRAGPDEDAVALTARIAAAVSRLQAEGASDWYSSLRGPDPESPQGADRSIDPAEGSWRRVWSATAPLVETPSHQARVWR